MDNKPASKSKQKDSPLSKQTSDQDSKHSSQSFHFRYHTEFFY